VVGLLRNNHSRQFWSRGLLEVSITALLQRTEENTNKLRNGHYRDSNCKSSLQNKNPHFQTLVSNIGLFILMHVPCIIMLFILQPIHTHTHIYIYIQTHIYVYIHIHTQHSIFCIYNPQSCMFPYICIILREFQNLYFAKLRTLLKLKWLQLLKWGWYRCIETCMSEDCI
jgi:hypothetical protein